MRKRYLVTYDICHPKRLRKVFKTMKGFGAHIQYSVFRCDLDAAGRIELIAALTPIIDHHEDQVLIVDLGPATGRARSCIEAIGRGYTVPEPESVVI